MIVLGGIGSIPGVILGAVIVGVLQSLHAAADRPALPLQLAGGSEQCATALRRRPRLQCGEQLDLGIVLVLMILLRPQGLIPDRRRSRELNGDGAAPESESAVGLLALEEAGVGETEPGFESRTVYSGAGSDAQPRRKGESASWI